MILFDLINEQVVTQPPQKLPAAGGVPVPAQVNTTGDAAKTVVAQPKPATSTAKPQPTGPAAAQQAAMTQPTATAQQPGAVNKTSMEQSQAELEERVMQRMQELAGMLRR